MRRIEEPGRNDRTVLFAIGDGRFLRVDQDVVRELGLKKIAEMYGILDLLPQDRVPVTQDGKVIGTMPAEFDPDFIKSTSFFYDPRPGDFIRTPSGWEAARSLGPGDFEAITGFAWSREVTRSPDTGEGGDRG